MVNENLVQVKRLAGALASKASDFRMDIGLLETYMADLSDSAQAKYSGKISDTIAEVSACLSDIGTFVSATEVLASDKQPPLTVPDLSATTLTEATTILSGGGFSNIRTIDKDGGIAGDIVRQYPPAGTIMARSDEVQLFVYVG